MRRRRTGRRQGLAAETYFTQDGSGWLRITLDHSGLLWITLDRSGLGGIERVEPLIADTRLIERRKCSGFGGRVRFGCQRMTTGDNRCQPVTFRKGRGRRNDQDYE